MKVAAPRRHGNRPAPVSPCSEPACYHGNPVAIQFAYPAPTHPIGRIADGWLRSFQSNIPPNFQHEAKRPFSVGCGGGGGEGGEEEWKNMTADQVAFWTPSTDSPSPSCLPPPFHFFSSFFFLFRGKLNALVYK